MNKIVGLSFGRKNGNSELFLKSALMGAEELGVESEIIRAAQLKILPCDSCGACMKSGKCPKDDVDWILENTMLADAALIVAAPVYHVRPPSSLIAVSEKLNHHFMAHPEIHELKKLSAAISVGGSGYEGWSSLGLPMIQLFLQHFSTLVDQIQINHCADKGAALTSDNEWAVERCYKLGRNLAEAMKLPFGEVSYKGDDSPISCPVCHCNIFYFENGLPEIMCPTCQVHGTVSYKDGNYIAEWNEDDIKNPRFSTARQHHHMEWIMNHAKEEGPQLALTETQKKLKRYETYGNYLQPEKTSKKTSKEE